MPAQVILAFANDQGDSLQSLKRESSTIYDYLLKLGGGVVNPVLKSGVTINDLFSEFLSRQDDITIFHFSGHAGQLDLLFESGKLVSGEGVALLMEETKNIELVFLNGCATKGLIDAFHAAGVKRVIATSKKVFDDFAAEFAIKFYESLSQYSSIGDAFNYAKKFMVTAKKEDVKYIDISRHISTGALKPDDSDDFPYTMYYKPVVKYDGTINDNIDDYNRVDEWKFSDYKLILKPYSPCIKLLKAIGNKGIALVKYLRATNSKDNEEIKEFGELDRLYRNFTGGNQDINNAGKLSDKIMKLFPRPLGIIMRQMVTSAKDIPKDPDTYYKELLKYQLHFYDVMLKFSCYTMLSDLYEVIQKKKEIIELNKELDSDINEDIYFDKKTQDDINKMLSLEEKEVNNFNYRELIKNIRLKILDNCGSRAPFVGEYVNAAAYNTNDILERAHENIKFKKNQYYEGKITNEWVEYCKDVEDELCKIFQEVYFIMRYNLLVIRNIEAIKVRFKKDRMYQHKYFILRGSNSLGIDTADEKDYTDSYSVILVKGLKSIIDYLSLSPFIIDRCVLTDDESSELYYFSYCNNDVIVYEGVEDTRQKIEIKINYWDDEELDESDNVVLVKKINVPYVDELVRKYPNLNENKMTIRLKIINDQFYFIKSEFKSLVYKTK